jgi:hypothetical protein
MEPQQGTGDDGSARWEELRAQCERLQAATLTAWGNAFEAYKAVSAGGANPNAVDPDDALTQYKTAKALQLAAEQAMQAYVEAQKPPKPG